MKEVGFTYDCSINEGFEWWISGGMTIGDFYWPYTLDNGSPSNDLQNDWYSSTYNVPIRNHKGLWELPCYAFKAPADLIPYLDQVAGYETDGKVTGLDYNMWAKADEGGFVLNKVQSISVLKNTLDQLYKGNRTPMTVGIHSQYYSKDDDLFPNILKKEDKQAFMEEFLDYAFDATKFPDVRIVSGRKCIEWCMNPVALGATPIISEITKPISSPVIGTVISNKVEISIHENGKYTLSVYSLTGRQIQVIKNGHFRKNYYTISWNSNTLGKQVYVIRLEGNGYKTGKKVFLSN